MDEQNRDNFYEGPPLEDPDHWHDGAVIAEPDASRGADGAERAPRAEAAEKLSRDPSLSRAVEREAEGLDAQSAGYDRAAEGAPPGPLEPAADARPADSPELPASEWGSSG